MGQLASKYIPSTLEHFADPERFPLSGTDGIEALNKAEQIDQYIAAINNSPINILARRDTSYVPSFHAVGKAIPPPDSPWPAGQVIWMDPTADNGLPHTRAPDYICLPSTIPSSQITSTVLHERVHVSQRLHYDAWVKLLKDAWKMAPWTGFFPNSIDERRRINPDIFGVPYFIWDSNWVPLGLFKSKTSPLLKEIDIVWWDVKTRTLHTDAPPGWSEFFGTHPAGEHPYELAAYLIVEAPADNKAYKELKSRLSSLPSS